MAGPEEIRVGAAAGPSLHTTYVISLTAFAADGSLDEQAMRALELIGHVVVEADVNGEGQAGILDGRPDGIVVGRELGRPVRVVAEEQPDDAGQLSHPGHLDRCLGHPAVGDGGHPAQTVGGVGAVLGLTRLGGVAVGGHQPVRPGAGGGRVLDAAPHGPVFPIVRTEATALFIRRPDPAMLSSYS